MTKREYLNRLESCLICIERGEREAALRYYSDYFDDAGMENEQAVIAELGSPEALARQIIAEAGGGGEAKREATGKADAMGEFHSIKADIVNANLTVQVGGEWAVDVRYPEGMDVPRITVINGTLTIEEEQKRKFWGVSHIGSWKPGRIDITVPDIQFREFRIENVNGAIRIPPLRVDTLRCETVNGSVLLEGVRADSINAQSVNGSVSLTGCRSAVKCKAETVNGSVTLGGELRGTVKAGAVNGAIRVSSTLPITEYNVDISTLSGSIRIDGEKHRREVHIAHQAQNSVKASTVNGGITLDFVR